MSSDTTQETLKILLFYVAGVRFGVDAAQVERVSRCAESVTPGVDAFFLHEKMAFPNPPDHPSTIMLHPNPAVGHAAMMIDQLEEMHTLEIEAIRPIPPLMRREKGLAAFWGFALVDNALVILIDFARLTCMEQHNPQTDNTLS